MFCDVLFLFFFQAEDGIRDLVRSRGLGDVYKRQAYNLATDERRVVCAAEGDQRSPLITGEWVVWEDARDSTAGGDDRTWDVYAFNLETGQELAVCTDPGNHGWLSVSR